jgi:hypothetical protein
MARSNNFVFRVNDEERRLITVLAKRLRRTESDAIRLVIRKAARALAPELTNVSELEVVDQSGGIILTQCVSDPAAAGTDATGDLR